MAITIFGRGFPMVMVAESDDLLTFQLDGGTLMALTNTGVVSATTFSGTSMAVTTVGGTTLTATTVSGTTFKATTVTATDLSSTNVKATTATASTFSGAAFSGSIATSAGGTNWAFSAPGSATMGAQVTSANRWLNVVVGGTTYYVPAFTTYAGSGGAV